jgi:hypothetical protein
LNQYDIVPPKLIGHDFDFPFSHFCDSRQDLSRCRPAVEVIPQVLLNVVGGTHKGQHGFAKGFAGDRARLCAHAPQEPSPFNNGDPFP